MATSRQALGSNKRVGAVLAMIVVLASSCAWIARASVATDGTPGDAASANIALSGDGRFAVFESSASTLSPLQNGLQQIYRHDFVTQTTELVSRQFGCGPCTAGDALSKSPDISADGRYVVFQSAATNLVADSNGVSDIFVVDMVSSSIQRASLTSSGTEAIGGPSRDPTIADDGTKVAFASSATNLVAGDTNGFADVFVRDLDTHTTSLISVSTTGGPANGVSGLALLSGDGEAVAFASSATNLTSTSAPGIFLRLGATTTLIVQRFGGVLLTPVSIDADGDRIAVFGDDGFLRSVEVFNASGTTIASYPFSTDAALNSDGSRVVLRDPSGRAALVDRDVPSASGVVSTNLGGTVMAEVSDVAIAADGRTAGFASADAGLVPGDTNGVADVFAKSIPLARIDTVTPGVLPAGQATDVTISGTGFDDVLTLYFGPRTVTSAVTLVDAETISATVAVEPNTAAGPRSPFVGVDGPGPGYTTALCVDCVTIG